MHIPVLNGYVKLIEAWGTGEAGKDYHNPDAIDYERGIIEAARQSTQGSFRGWEPYTHEGREYPRGDVGLLDYLHTHKHATPFEFSGCVVEVQAPIFVFREWHRHRTQSYNEMSARYSPLPDNNYMPTVERCLLVNGKNKQAGSMAGSEELTHEKALEWLDQLADVYVQCEGVYQSGLACGIPKEIARICLPVGRYSRMRASANLRNWLGFVTLRSSPDAQWEIRQYSDAVGRVLESTFPHVWELFSKKV